MPLKTVLVRYHGDVQGVGFRHTARRIAQEWDIKGWVKNEPDGTVALIATADSNELEAFLKAIRDSRLGLGIEREVVEPQVGPVHELGFGIKY